MTSEQEDQIDRRETLRQDASLRQQQGSSTFLDHVEEPPGGRFAIEGRPYKVGSEPFVKYPQLPASSPWHSDPVPDEKALGHSIDAMSRPSSSLSVEAGDDTERELPPTQPVSSSSPDGPVAKLHRRF
jgi:hypothetical protein